MPRVRPASSSRVSPRTRARQVAAIVWTRSVGPVTVIVDRAGFSGWVHTEIPVRRRTSSVTCSLVVAADGGDGGA